MCRTSKLNGPLSRWRRTCQLLLLSLRKSHDADFLLPPVKISAVIPRSELFAG
jgi:hypothetical protein